MTPRARLYLLATALYCIGIGLSCALVPQLFTSSSFTQIRSMAPCGFAGWAFAHFLVAAVSLFASYKGSEKWAYSSLMGATIMVGPWAAGFWIAFFNQPLTHCTNRNDCVHVHHHHSSRASTTTAPQSFRACDAVDSTP
jgi:MFS family permease